LGVVTRSASNMSRARCATHPAGGPCGWG
jgi:hypothetical protein